MIISHSKRFIFIHIYKTGGTSVSSALIPYARPIEKISGYYWPSRKVVSLINKLFKLQDQGNAWFNGVHKHASALEAKRYLRNDIYHRYFKFAFVRNPYDLQVSLYHYIRQAKEHRAHELANTLSFKDFVFREIARGAPLQADFITDNDGNVIIDYIGKTEDLDNEISYIASCIGIKVPKVERLNQSNRSRSYEEYYTDDLKTAVYEYYKKDFELLGYDGQL